MISARIPSRSFGVPASDTLEDIQCVLRGSLRFIRGCCSSASLNAIVPCLTTLFRIALDGLVHSDSCGHIADAGQKQPSFALEHLLEAGLSLDAYDEFANALRRVLVRAEDKDIADSDISEARCSNTPFPCLCSLLDGVKVLLMYAQLEGARCRHARRAGGRRSRGRSAMKRIRSHRKTS